MKRNTPLSRRRALLKRHKPLLPDPKAVAEWREGSRAELPKRNGKRLAKREREEYGPKGEWIRSLSCYVTGAPPRSVAAHVKSRGAGGKSKDLVPFHPRVEIDWHGMVEAAFENKYGVGKQDCRDAAERYEAAWRELVGTEE
jgi:hypothetical protein